MAKKPSNGKLEKGTEIFENIEGDHFQAELAGQNGERQFQDIFNNSVDGILVFDTNGVIVLANPAAVKLYGYSQEALIGLSGKDIVHPDYYYLFEDFKKQLEKNGKFYAESVDVKKDGTQFNIEVHGSSFVYRNKPHLLAIVRDITERKRAEKTLRENELKFRTLIDQAPEALFMHDMEGRIRDVNKACIDRYGYTREELLYLSARDIDPDYVSRENSGEFWKKLDMKKQIRFQARHRRKDGTIFPVEINLTAIEIENQRFIIALASDITERVQSDEMLRESEEKYRTIFESSIVGFYQSTPDGRFTTVNAAFAQMLGYASPEELVSSISDIATQYYDNPEDRRQFQKRLKESGYVENYEFRAKRKDGSKIWVSNSTRAYFKDSEVIRYEGIVIDITERKQAEVALRESEERFKTLVEQSPLGVSLIGVSGRYKYVNPQFVDMFGYTMEDIPTGTEWFKTAFPDIHDRHRVIKTWIEDQKVTGVGQARPRVFEVACKDGSKKLIHFRPVTLENKDQFVIYEDITERTNLEEQLRQSQKMGAIGTLAGGVAHEFNNILAIILGNTELALMETPEWSPSKKSLHEIQSASLRARDIVKQILSFARKAPTQPKAVEIAVVVKETLKLMRATIPAEIEIRQDILCGSEVVSADPSEIHQVVMNLCTNAAQAMKGSDGVLRVRLEPMRLDKESVFQYEKLPPGDYVKLTVKDTGPGISPEIFDRIFEPFFTTREVGKGTGMGLAVVYGIVKKYGGAIKAASEAGKGSHFEVLLPQVEDLKKDKTEEKENMLKGTERILFVDDEESIANLTSRTLARQGYSVETLTDSLEALERFRAEPASYDLVISDMAMPYLAGDNLAQEIMKIRPDIPIILCTGHSERLDETQAKAIGINAFVMKPLSSEELAKTVRKVLDEAKG